ncbi:RagB/SusD family nutrient uptake outer membrane protein [Sphingobacterium kitahiroshimense]|uniref:RagB/SusD family nutrient uptake outer membrane protein n=1 Tax=Sphingobacterium kitahiroshimense TaxID=470446 RepID=A0ABV0BPN6_9SPHI
MKRYKIIYHIICTISVMFSLSGCTKDFLQPNPLSFYTPENTYNTPEGLLSALQAAAKNAWYEKVGSGAPYNTQMFFSDLAVDGATDATNSKDFAAQLNPDAGGILSNDQHLNIQWYWNSVYKGIKYANTVVTYIDLPKWDTTQTEQRKQRNALLGGAYFWRAYYYYYLTNCFGDVPWVGKLYLTPKLDFYTTSRSTILLKLKSDLEYASEWVEDGGVKGLATKGAVLHLLTKVNLALEKFDDAVVSADKLINSGPYRLMTARFGLDVADASKNIIWDMHRPENISLPVNAEGLLIAVNRANLSGNIGANQWIRNGSPFWGRNINTPNGNTGMNDAVGVEIDLNSTYGRGVGFVRATWYSTHMIWGAGTNSANDLRHAPGNWMRMEDLVYNSPALKGTDSYYGKPLQKYSNTGALLCSDTIRSWYDWPHYKLFVFDPTAATSSQEGGYSDMYLFRLAETYLLRAEAFLWKGDANSAAADINVIRKRAGAEPLNPEQVHMGTLLDERARELYYEEERKIELTRIAYTYAATGKTAPTGKTYTIANFADDNFWYDWLMLKNNFYNKGVKTALGISYTMKPNFVLWPVPAAAIAGNTQGVINQNTGYPGTAGNLPALTTITE